jgi:hypothetical protein
MSQVSSTSVTAIIKEFGKVLPFNATTKKEYNVLLKMAQTPKFDQIDLPRFVERSIAILGGYNFVDGHGYDFDDNDWSDAKVIHGTLRTGYKNQQYPTLTGGAMDNKIGTLRIIAYGIFDGIVRCYAIPNEVYRGLQTLRLDPNGKYKDYQVANPKELANKMFNTKPTTLAEQRIIAGNPEQAEHWDSLFEIVEGV